MKKTHHILLISGGVFNIIFGAFHLMFHRVFHWDTELARLTTINSNIMQMLNYALVIFFLMMGVILLLHHKEILTSRLGKSILLLMSAMFGLRLILEVVLPGGSLMLGGILMMNILLYFIPLLSIKVANADKTFAHE